MIKTPTVFVLGAGASAPYGVPLGPTLVTEIADKVHKDNSTLFRLVRECGFPKRLLHEFGTDLIEAGRDSIDAFLQMRPEYLDIGKACIAAMLLPFERERELDIVTATNLGEGDHVTERRARRWYHYLFNQMLTEGAFEENKLSIITFNFDRSFERALYRTLRATYPGADSASVLKRCRTIPIVHMHGALGALSWLEESPGSRSYGSQNPSFDEVQACAKQIQLVSDDMNPETIERAKALLAAADTVCFLGFSFHPLNLRKLNHDQLTSGKSRQIRATAFKMPNGPRGAVKRRFEKKIVLAARDWDILTFLQETRFIHE